jgi:hypothetical protein
LRSVERTGGPVQHGAKHKGTADDPEKSEEFVRVKWLDAVDANKAFSGVGSLWTARTRCASRRRRSGDMRWIG